MTRIDFIDISKGIGILLVVFGHICIVPEATKFVYSFHMPLFFLISGVTSKGYTFQNSDLFKKKFKTLMIPYFIWYFLFWIYWFCLERNFRFSDVEPLDALLAGVFCLCKGELMIPNIVLWFLPTLFVIEIFCSFLKLNIYHLLCAVLLVVLFPWNKFILPDLPYGILQALAALPFFIGGAVFKSNIISLANSKVKYLIIIFVVSIIGVSFLSTYNLSVDIRSLILGRPFLFIINGFLGSISVLTFSMLISSQTSVSAIGKRTLTIMLIHEPLKRIIVFVISKIVNISVNEIRTNFLFVAFTMFMIVFLLIYLDIFLNRYFPYLLGKSQN